MREMCDTITGQSQGKSRLHDVITTMNIHMHILLLLPFFDWYEVLGGKCWQLSKTKEEKKCSQTFQLIVSKASFSI